MTPDSHGNRLASYLGMFVLGAAAGAAIALLTAPRDGRETRERLKRTLSDLGQSLERVPDAIRRAGSEAMKAGTAAFAQARDDAAHSSERT